MKNKNHKLGTILLSMGQKGLRLGEILCTWEQEPGVGRGAPGKSPPAWTNKGRDGSGEQEDPGLEADG